jgi:hypothetical protein
MKRKLVIPLVVMFLSIAAVTATKMFGAKDHPEGFHFLHSIHLDDEAILTKHNLVIQPLMLSKDHDYDFVLKNTSDNVLVTIKDDRGKVLATNYDEKTQKYYRSLVFQSHITEFYHIEIKAEQVQKNGQCVVYSKCHLDKKNDCKH